MYGRFRRSDEELRALELESASREWKAPPRWLPRLLHSLAYRNFLLLWLAQGSNSVVLWTDLVARPILVMAITGSAVHLGLVSMARGIPMLILTPYAGVLADRIDRRKVMLASKALNMALHIAFAVLILTGHLQLWHIYFTALLKSVLNAFDQPARQAVLPSLVPPRLLMNAVALNSGTMQFSRLVSASLAGFLIGLWALGFGYQEDDAQAFGGVYLIAAFMSVLAVAATYLLRVPLAGRPWRTNLSWFTSFLQGLRFARESPIILGVLILFGIIAAFGMPYQQVFVPYLAIQVMDIGPHGAGMLIAVASVGSLLGAMAVATWGHLLRRRGLFIIVGLFVFGLGLIGVGLTSSLPLTAIMGLTLPLLPMLLILLVGLAQNALMATKNGLLLEITPNELRGRIMSLQHMDRGFSTVGSGTGGFAIAAVGGPYALALFGGLCALGALITASALPGLRKAD